MRKTEDEMASAKATIDHDEIRKWVEARGGNPAHVKRTGSKRGDPGVLRIDYPGFSGEETLERIDWDQWFDWFDRDKLAFLYQDEKKSRFSKLVDRSSVSVSTSSSRKRSAASKKSAASSKKSSSKKASSKKASSKKAASKKASSKKSSSKKASSKKSSSKKAAAKRR
jgi:hypothetical protein